MIASIKRTVSVSRRMLAMAVILSLIFIGFLCAGVIVKAQSNSPSVNDKIYYTNITVESGDTLWDIASEYIDYGHYANIYEYMEHLRRLNHLTSDDLYAGEHIMVTYYEPQ